MKIMAICVRHKVSSTLPGKGSVMFVAACIVSVGGYREKQKSRSCNETYVSDACCAATDGIEHEPDHLKLGELLPAYEHDKQMSSE